MDEDQLRVLTDKFHAAAIGAECWEHALSALAAATGSRAGNLIGIGADAAIPFNWLTNVDPETINDFAALNGGDPEVNPRVRAGFPAGELEILSDADYMTADEHKTTPIFSDFYRRHDIPFICQTNLVKTPEMVIGLSVNRTQSEGHIHAEQRHVFAAIAAHARAAVRTQLALEGQGAQLIAGALDALSIAAFVCDRSGQVLARSPLTETLLSGQGPLRLRDQRLTTRSPSDAERLTRAMAAAASGRSPPMSGLLLSSGGGAPPVLLEMALLPAQAHGFSLQARVLVVARMGRPDAGTIAALLQSAFAVTGAEAQIGAALLEGRSPEQIAAARNATLNTVRTQIKTLYAKLGVQSRSEFWALLRSMT